MVDLNHFEIKAKSVLPTMVYDYYASGACDEISIKKNRQAYEDINLIPRILNDISTRNLSTTILNQSISLPILIAPMSFHGMATADAEIATARAAKSVDTIMIASTMANTTLEDIAVENARRMWFQLYILNDRSATLDLVQRAEHAGYQALVLTVDSQVLGIRYKDLYNKFELPPHLEVKNLTTSNQFQNKLSSLKIDSKSQNLFDKKLTWKDIEWLQSITKLPIILKGVLHKSDAKIALSNNINGIIVSNHGGRQLDTVIPTITALPEIAAVIEGKIPILIDGGIRRGTDVIKAIALGADAVLIGRPILWGLATDGTNGAIAILNILKNEFDTAMALCGFSSIEKLKESGREILHFDK